jgi:hypothetical protein
MWLWAKYVVVPNLEKHCTASLRSLTVKTGSGRGSPYSQRFSKASNPLMGSTTQLVMDENQARPCAAIYLCGVSAAGYAQKSNYPHNLHAAIVPSPGRTDSYCFEGWTLTIENGLFTRIPSQADLPTHLLHLPPAYVTCRIFRWAACILPQLLDDNLQHVFPNPATSP